MIFVYTTNIHNWILWWFLPLVSLLFAFFLQTTGVWRPSGGRQQEQVACVICETCPVASRTISEKVCSFHSSRMNHASLSLHNHSKLQAAIPMPPFTVKLLSIHFLFSYYTVFKIAGLETLWSILPALTSTSAVMQGPRHHQGSKQLQLKTCLVE